MKKHLPIMLSLCLNIVLILQVYSLGQDLRQFRTETLEEFSAVRGLVTNHASILDERITALVNGPQLVQNYDLSISGHDENDQSLLLTCSLNLREWSESTQVTLLVTQEGQTAPFPLVHQGSGLFSGPVTLRHNAALSLTASVTTGQVSSSETLVEDRPLRDFALLQGHSAGYSGTDFEDGQFSLYTATCGVEHLNREGTPELTEPTFCLLRSGEVVEEYPATLDMALPTWINYRLDGGLTVPLQDGDTLRLMFRCADSMGLRYQFEVGVWSVKNDTLILSANDGRPPKAELIF